MQNLAEAKLRDAEYLLSADCYANAYYLADYAVEFGLKACIAKQFSEAVIPDRGFVNDIYSHSLRKLVGLAGLSKTLKDREQRDPVFAANWALATEWGPEFHYRSADRFTAQIFLQALTHESQGVMPWIRTVW